MWILSLLLALILVAALQVWFFQRYGFKWAETGPQMETNEGVLSQWQYLEATIHRRHRCYRKKL